VPGTIAGVLPPGATAFAQTAGTSAPSAQGWAEVASTGRISVQANFVRSGIPAGTDSEAAVIGSQSGNNILMPFDNTQGFVTGLAIANTNAVQSVSVTITAILENGGPNTTPVIPLRPHGHVAIVMPTALPATANTRGTVKFSGGTGTDLSVIACALDLETRSHRSGAVSNSRAAVTRTGNLFSPFAFFERSLFSKRFPLGTIIGFGGS
jgi:hypothetical protein